MTFKFPFRLLVLISWVLLASCGGGRKGDPVPGVAKTDPLNHATGVPVGSPIRATFSYAVDPVTVNGNTFIVSGVSGTVTYQDQTATFTPSVPLAKGQTYYASLTNGVKDLDGIPLLSTYTWSFTTEAGPDTTPPTIETTVPAPNATGVCVSAPIVVQFSEPIQPATINSQTFFVKGVSAATLAYDETARTAKLIPSSPLSYATPYTATVTKGVQDLTGNSLAADHSWSFATAPQACQAPPQIISKNPADNAVNVSPNTHVTVTFDKDIDATSLTSNFILNDPNGAGVAAQVRYDAKSRTATLDPINDLAPNTKYEAFVQKGVKDLSGNATTSDTVWFFTAGAGPDVTPPTIISHQPDGKDVKVKSQIVVTFSEPIQADTLTGASFKVTTATGEVVNGRISYAPLSQTATFDPSGPRLQYSATYAVVLTNGIQDLAGNGLIPFSWTFITIEAPHVISDSPTGVNISTSTTITATFSTDMNSNTIDPTSFLVAAAPQTDKPQGNPISGNVTYANRVATFTPAAQLSSATTYQVTLTTDIQDSQGNPLESPYPWSFTTGQSPPPPDTTPPSVVAVSPPDQAQGVSVNTPILVRFSEAMNPGTINSQTFFLDGGGAGTITYDSTHDAATLAPNSPLAYATTYTATVTQGALDLADNPLQAPQIWSFTTEAAPDTTPPTVVSTDPADRATNVPAAAQIGVTFSETVDHLTINSGTFQIAPTGGAAVAGSYCGVDPQGVCRDGIDSATYLFTSSAPLADGTLYQGTLTSGIKDMAGNALAGTTWSFTTAPPAAN